MRGTGADARGKGFEALADGDNEGTWKRGAVDPGTSEVLSLEAGVRGHLQQIGSEH